MPFFVVSLHRLRLENRSAEEAAPMRIANQVKLWYEWSKTPWLPRGRWRATSPTNCWTWWPPTGSSKFWNRTSRTSIREEITKERSLSFFEDIDIADTKIAARNRHEAPTLWRVGASQWQTDLTLFVKGYRQTDPHRIADARRLEPNRQADAPETRGPARRTSIGSDDEFPRCPKSRRPTFWRLLLRPNRPYRNRAKRAAPLSFWHSYS